MEVGSKVVFLREIESTRTNEHTEVTVYVNALAVGTVKYISEDWHTAIVKVFGMEVLVYMNDIGEIKNG
jgi:hypothetical protein